MSKDVYTKIIENLAKGCMGLRYSYFTQDMVDENAMKRDYAILGDFKGKDGNPWRGGICFGFSVLYLAGCTPTGRLTWPSPDALMAEFSDAFSGTGKSVGMLQAVAQAYVRQQGASSIRRRDMQNPEVLACKGCSRQYAVSTVMVECMRCGSKNLERKRLRQEDMVALARRHHMTPDKALMDRYERYNAQVTSPLLEKTLQSYRARERKGSAVVPELDDVSDKFRHAIRDQLVANFSLKPGPRHDDDGVRQNYKKITLAIEKAGFYDYKNHLQESDLATLLSFVGEKNTFSLFSYEVPFVGGHQMAFWSDGSRTSFFDPNFGVISFSWQSGLKTFLSNTRSWAPPGGVGSFVDPSPRGACEAARGLPRLAGRKDVRS